jgi:NADPH-dependent 2,4-dienoyl-CoA reductase/sulfur reductase-like enzyme
MHTGLLRLAAALARRKQCSSVAALARSLSADAGAGSEQPAPRERMEYDVCIVGAGPAGLAAAIRFKQVRFVFRRSPLAAAAARRRRALPS